MHYLATIVAFFAAVRVALVVGIRCAMVWLAKGGWRWVGASILPVCLLTSYATSAGILSKLWDAIGVVREVPSEVRSVASFVSGQSSGIDNSWLSMVNYILPLDFVCTCLCLYFSMWVSCFVVRCWLLALDVFSKSKKSKK